MSIQHETGKLIPGEQQHDDHNWRPDPHLVRDESADHSAEDLSDVVEHLQTRARVLASMEGVWQRMQRTETRSAVELVMLSDTVK
jgi:hypothetical protein